MKTTQIFEVLIVDPSGKSEITTVKSLVLAISYSEKLWKNPLLNEDHTELDDKATGITLQATKLSLPTDQAGVAFLVKVSSDDVVDMESFRELLFVHAIHKLGFNTARILVDTVSETVSGKIYPLIKSTENALRLHLEKEFTQRQGLSWWDLNAPREMNQQVFARTASETNLKGLVDPRMALTDFNALSTLALKSTSLDASFASKWNKLSVFRDRVLSYSAFVSKEYVEVEQLCQELSGLLGTSLPHSEVQVLQKSPGIQAPVNEMVQKEEKPPVVLSEKVPHVPQETFHPEPEKEETPPIVSQETKAVQETSAPLVAQPQPASNGGNFDMITEGILLQELKIAQSMDRTSYVDLKAFVTKTLEPKGYAVGSSYLVAKSMNEKGLLQIYDAKNEKGALVKAIRTN